MNAKERLEFLSWKKADFAILASLELLEMAVEFSWLKLLKLVCIQCDMFPYV
jgi:hypothetical protein